MDIHQVHEIVFEITSHCNASCPQCPRFDSTGNLNSSQVTLDHLNFEWIKQNLDKSKLKNLKQVTFEGDRGDALMHPNILDFLNFFDFVPNILLITNGSIRNTSWWKQLAQISNLTVVMSIDGLNDTNKLYRVGLNYDTIMDNATAFISNGGRLGWKYIVFKHNEHQIETAIELSKSMGFFGIRFEYPLAERFLEHGDPIKKYKVYIDKKISHTIELPTLTKSEINQKSVLHKEFSLVFNYANFQKYTCPWRRRGRLYVTYQGHVIPCCMQFDLPMAASSTPDGQKFLNLIGSLRNISIESNSLEEILNNEFYSVRLDDSLNNTNLIQSTCSSCIKSQ
jgi:sulfatase maturation enzyme AslB (radical SAM superfamily)